MAGVTIVNPALANPQIMVPPTQRPVQTAMTTAIPGVVVIPFLTTVTQVPRTTVVLSDPQYAVSSIEGVASRPGETSAAGTLVAEQTPTIPVSGGNISETSGGGRVVMDRRGIALIVGLAVGLALGLVAFMHIWRRRNRDSELPPALLSNRPKRCTSSRGVWARRAQSRQTPDTESNRAELECAGPVGCSTNPAELDGTAPSVNRLLQWRQDSATISLPSTFSSGTVDEKILIGPPPPIVPNDERLSYSDFDDQKHMTVADISPQ